MGGDSSKGPPPDSGEVLMHMNISTPRLQMLIANFAALGRFSKVLFILTFASFSLAVSLAVGYSLGQLGLHQDDRIELLRHGIGGFFLMVVVFGPAIETL